ncbi:hypothetical protein ACR79M_11665 [Sphingobacterium spiritivorum]|uniref:hypothetical protein n=1 Tax=Sphingobacterium spiritivorum TaxID=258 RepID=UPI00191A9026|nr:hypothetical protein [Sphingobacterium spiritivorum]QQT27951.1 hypothetical protein I6J02_08965 [Sphingobacterium spiritivorum]
MVSKAIKSLYYVLLILISFTVNGTLVSAQNNIDISVYPKVDLINSNWSIAGNIDGKNPNILSELTWKDNVAWGAGARFSVILHPRIKLSLQAEHSFIVSGTVRDVDYSGDNRTLVDRDMTYDSGEGNVSFATLQLNYLLWRGGIDVEGYVFPQYQYTSLTMIDPTLDLRSTYKSKLLGGGIGLKLGKVISPKWKMSLSPQFALNKYTAVANWNLREEFAHPVSFKHKIDAPQWSGVFDVTYSPTSKLYFLASARYNSLLNAKNGTDQLFYSNGESTHTRLNEVGSSIATFSLGAGILLY